MNGAFLHHPSKHFQLVHPHSHFHALQFIPQRQILDGLFGLLAQRLQLQLQLRDFITDTHQIVFRMRQLPLRFLLAVAVLGDTGSFFKNPVVERAVAEKLLNDYPEMPHYPTAEAGKVKLAAGWLIDRAGLKGYREGRVGVHEKQALVLVNYGGADGAAVIALAHKVQQEVKKQFGIAIDTEVNIL